MDTRRVVPATAWNPGVVQMKYSKVKGIRFLIRCIRVSYGSAALHFAAKGIRHRRAYSASSGFRLTRADSQT
jgi:hypothetical protein